MSYIIRGLGATVWKKKQIAREGMLEVNKTDALFTFELRRQPYYLISVACFLGKLIWNTHHPLLDVIKGTRLDIIVMCFNTCVIYLLYLARMARLERNGRTPSVPVSTPQLPEKRYIRSRPLENYTGISYWSLEPVQKRGSLENTKLPAKASPRVLARVRGLSSYSDYRSGAGACLFH